MYILLGMLFIFETILFIVNWIEFVEKRGKKNDLF